jgi:hypothetical protein
MAIQLPYLRSQNIHQGRAVGVGRLKKFGRGTDGL